MNTNVYIPESPYLKNVIHSVWQVDGFTPFQNELIIPMGIVEIIFSFGEDDTVQAIIDGKEYELPRYFISGFNTSPIDVKLPKRHIYFGIRFHPGAVKSIFGFQAREFTNRAVDLALLDSFFHSLWHQLAEKGSFNERVAVISEWIGGRMILIDPQAGLLNTFLCNPFAETPTVPELATTLCYSPRHLSRKIYGLTNMNTEELLLYKKYLRSVHLIHTTELSLTEIAYEGRFADQSHFIRSFKAFAQMTPGEYKQRKSHMPGHIYENVR